MSAGGAFPGAGPGGLAWYQGEPFSGDPSVSPGLPRPIGWEVRHPDGTAAWFKTGPLDTDWTAFTDLGGAKTLAELYTAGLVDPTDDNLFPMASGNLRFPGDVASESFPNAAFFESSSTPGDGRVAAWYTRRYYRVASSVGSVEGDNFVGFDPLWSGSLGDLNDFTIVPERTGFTSDPSEAGNLSFMELGSQRLEVQGGFFDGPITSPTPGFNSGTRARRDTYLRNALDGLQRRQTVTGWGQSIGYPLSAAAGITADRYSAADFSNAPATDGNGIGWFIGYGVSDPLPDPPRAIYEAHCLSGAAPSGAWGLGFWAAASAGTISNIATWDWTNGAIFDVALKAPAATLSSFIDFTGAAAPPVAPAASARFYWDDTNQAFQLSADGLPYGINAGGVLPVCVTFPNGTKAVTLTANAPNLAFVQTSVQRWFGFTDGLGGVLTVPSWS